jgi:peptidyl-prolyl cis-trans isomerase C
MFRSLPTGLLMTPSGFPALVLATLFAAAPASYAQVAKVNGVAIPQTYFDVVLQAQTGRGQPDSPDLRKGIKETLINQEIITQEAVKKGLQKNPTLAAQISLQRQEMLVNVHAGLPQEQPDQRGYAQEGIRTAEVRHRHQGA